MSLKTLLVTHPIDCPLNLGKILRLFLSFNSKAAIVLFFWTATISVPILAQQRCRTFFSARLDQTPQIFNLFEADGNPAPNYREIIFDLIPGDQICFKGCKYKFIFQGFLGYGRTTEVLRAIEVNPDGTSKREVALRLPIDTGQTNERQLGHSTPFANYINEFIQGQKVLRVAGFRVPKIYASIPKQFVAVEVIPFEFSLKDFFDSPNLIRADVLALAERNLYAFAKTAAPFENIGDFYDQQLVYSQKDGWVLIDFNLDTRLTSPFRKRDRSIDNPLRFLNAKYTAFDTPLSFELTNRASLIIDTMNEMITKKSYLANRVWHLCTLFLCTGKNPTNLKKQ